MEVVGDRARRLAAAVEGRAHWRVEASWAIYQPEGAKYLVRVIPVPEGTPRKDEKGTYRWILIRIQGNVAERNRPCHTPDEAIRWAEQLQLD